MTSFIAIWRHNLCAVTGAIAGGLTGMVFGLLLISNAGAPIAASELLAIALLLAFVAWLMVLLVVGVWLHYGLTAVAAPALVTTVITALITVAIAYAVKFPYLATLIGLAVGTLVGALLCRLCYRDRLVSK